LPMALNLFVTALTNSSVIGTRELPT
jgi:hypothetical protein